MACTNKILDGSMMRLYIDGVMVAKDTSCELSVDGDTRETTSKISGGWKSFINGIKGFTVSGEALMLSEQDTTIKKTPAEIYAYLVSGAAVTAKIATETAADGYFEGDVIINSMTVTSGNSGENVTYSFSAQGTGELEHKIV